MDVLQQLGVALGLASLAGINLYLTVLLAGVLIRYDFIHLADQYHNLEVLGHPWVMAVAGVLFFLEFFADKVPWVDSLWDSVHTVIRPVGGTLLALQALGDMAPPIQLIAGLLAGGAALTTHSAKAGTRLLINHSPEPFSNVSMSLAEDIAVTGGVFLMLLKPVIALIVFSALLTGLWMVFPRIFRLIRSSLWLIWNKLRMPGRKERIDQDVELPCSVTPALLGLLAVKANLAEHDIAWTARCITGKSKGQRGLSANLDAVLVMPKEGRSAHLVATKGWREIVVEIPLGGARILSESKFLADLITIEMTGRTVALCFPRGHFEVVETIARKLRDRAGDPMPAVPEVAEVQNLSPLPAV